MQNNINTSMDQPVFNQFMDNISSSYVLPVSKLDADQYLAEDLDGVTESLSGSGNLNFLMMQSGQLNANSQSVSPFLIVGEGAHDGPIWSSMAGADNISAPFEAGASDISNAQPAMLDDGAEKGNFLSPAQAAQTSILPSESFSQTDTGQFLGGGNQIRTSSVNGLDGSDAGNNSGLNGSDGADGTNGVDGTPGADGGEDCCETVIDVDIDLGDIINLGDVNIDLGDITNVITTTITEITDIVHNILDGGLTLQLDTLISDITNLDLSLLLGDQTFDVINQIVDLSPVTDLLDPVIDLDGLILADVGSVLSLLHDGGHEHHTGDMDLGLGLDVLATDLPLVNGVTDILVDPVEDLVGDIDILADIGLDLFNSGEVDNATGDTDLVADLGLDLVDGGVLDGELHIPLDPLENIIGDIDIDVGAAVNLLADTAQDIVDPFSGGSQADNLFSAIGDTLGETVADISPLPDFGEELVSFDLLGGGNIHQAHGDTDLTLDGDIDVLGLDVIDIGFIDVPLDPIETILGDIDVDVNAVLDLLDQTDLHNITDNFVSDQDGEFLEWTENALPGVSDLLGCDTDHGIGDLLPAPIGDLTEGLGGLLDTASHSDGLLGGGLFG